MACLTCGAAGAVPAGAAGAVPAGAAAVPAVPLHTETWAYDDAARPGQCNGGLGASAALVRRWLTYAEVGCGPWRALGVPKAIADCHAATETFCQVLPYADTNLVYPVSAPRGLLASAAEGWFLHEPPPRERRRVTSPAYGGGYLMNQDDPGYQSWWRTYVSASFPGADGVFMDDQSPFVPFFGLSAGSSTEISSAAALQDAHAAMSNALAGPGGQLYPQVDNTLPDCGNPNEREQGIGPTGNMLTAPVIGLVAEGCPEENGRLTPYLPSLLDDIAQIDSLPNGFTTLLSEGEAGQPYSLRSRRVTEATVLLGYAPGRLVVWPQLEQNSPDLSIWPEEGIYPTQPLQSMSAPTGPGCLQRASGVACPLGGHNDVEVPGQPGVFRREFRRCYDRGALLGPCAAVLNDTDRSITVAPGWLAQNYTSSIGLRIPPGTTGDVQSGGSIVPAAAAFVPGWTVIAPGDALLLAGSQP